MNRKPYLQASGDYWLKQRMRALVRDDFRCQFHMLGLQPLEGVCTHEQPEKRLRALQVHHIKGRMNFLPHQIEGHDLSNLATICHAHHEVIHPHMRLERYGLNKSLDYEPPDKEY